MARLLGWCLGILGVSAGSPLPTPEFTIDLDQDPEHRFDQVIGHFNDTIQELMQKFGKPAVLDIAKKFSEHRGEEVAEFQAEIRGIAREANIPEYAIHMVQFLYEFQSLMVPVMNISWPWSDSTPLPEGWGMNSLASTFGGFGCTGIIIRDEEGSVYHGRNLDFSFAKWLQKMTFFGNFVKGGKKLFTAQMIAAYPAVITGMRGGSNGYTIEINTRFLDHWGGNEELLHNLFDNNRQPSGWVKRKVLEEIEDYEDAVEAFSTHHYIGTEYNIVSGVKKGCIIGRNPDEAAYRIDLNDERYIIMTNFDYIYGDIKEHFDPTSVMGIGHSRRKGAMKLLDQTERFTPESLMDLMFDKEVAAKDTMFQAVFNVEKDTMTSRLPPCESCGRCVDIGQCVRSKEVCCNHGGAHFTLECGLSSHRCGCLPDGACRVPHPHLDSSAGTEDCCSLEDHFSLACPGTRRCGKHPSLSNASLSNSVQFV